MSAASVMIRATRPTLRVGARHMKLSTAVQLFLVDARSRLSPATLTAYESDLNLLVSLAIVDAADSVLAFTPKLARDYMLRLSSRGLALGTLHRRRSTISEFARWGLLRRYWPEDPMRDAPVVRRPKYLPRPFTPEERGRLMGLDLDRPEERYMRSVLFWAGLRVTELCRLRRRDVIDPAGEELARIRVKGKGSKERVVPMTPELRLAMRAYLDDFAPKEPMAFILAQKGNGARCWQRRMVERRCHWWGRAAGVRDCTPHRFRHTTATLLLERGADIREVQEWLGHEDLNTTAIYTKVTAQQLDRAARLLSGIPLITPRTVPPPESAP